MTTAAHAAHLASSPAGPLCAATALAGHGILGCALLDEFRDLLHVHADVRPCPILGRPGRRTIAKAC